MTPQEKAIELVDKYKEHTIVVNNNVMIHSLSRAKKCAVIAVDETLHHLYDVNNATTNYWVQEKIDFLREVKEEIEKL